MPRSFALAALAMVTACAGASDLTAAGLEREVLVSAAASLTDAFEAIEQAFEAENPGVDGGFCTVLL